MLTTKSDADDLLNGTNENKKMKKREMIINLESFIAESTFERDTIATKFSI